MIIEIDVTAQPQPLKLFLRLKYVNQRHKPIVLSPCDSRKMSHVRNKLSRKDKRPLFVGTGFFANFVAFVLRTMGLILSGLYSLSTFTVGVFTGMRLRVDSHAAHHSRSSTNDIVRDEVSRKMSQPSFYANVRVMITMHDSAQLELRRAQVVNSFATYDRPGYQMLVPRTHYFSTKTKSRIAQLIGTKGQALEKFQRRLLTPASHKLNVLSVSEVASLYHFPYGEEISEGLSRSMSKQLPATNLIKRNR